jgi:hypothetical protein
MSSCNVILGPQNRMGEPEAHAYDPQHLFALDRTGGRPRVGGRAVRRGLLKLSFVPCPASFCGSVKPFGGNDRWDPGQCQGNHPGRPHPLRGCQRCELACTNSTTAAPPTLARIKIAGPCTLGSPAPRAAPDAWGLGRWAGVQGVCASAPHPCRAPRPFPKRTPRSDTGPRGVYRRLRGLFAVQQAAPGTCCRLTRSRSGTKCFLCHGHPNAWKPVRPRPFGMCLGGISPATGARPGSPCPWLPRRRPRPVWIAMSPPAK